MKPFVSRHCIHSMEGWRVSYFDETGPLVSLWSLNRRAALDDSAALMRATPEPIDAILQATLWHGKAAEA